jgi:hypothetical protein
MIKGYWLYRLHSAFPIVVLYVFAYCIDRRNRAYYILYAIPLFAIKHIYTYHFPTAWNTHQFAQAASSCLFVYIRQTKKQEGTYTQYTHTYWLNHKRWVLLRLLLEAEGRCERVPLEAGPIRAHQQKEIRITRGILPATDWTRKHLQTTCVGYQKKKEKNNITKAKRNLRKPIRRRY